MFETIIIILAVIYLLPTVHGYGKQHFAGIAILNIFLGWTFVGWVVALVWAVSDSNAPKTRATSKTPVSDFINGPAPSVNANRETWTKGQGGE
uniref:Putative superinfection immunity protein n=1 Tax=viral metagenome TaxID=1070528 RepID=A0A6M3J0P8_9ZZZZ